MPAQHVPINYLLMSTSTLVTVNCPWAVQWNLLAGHYLEIYFCPLKRTVLYTGVYEVLVGPRQKYPFRGCPKFRVVQGTTKLCMKKQPKHCSGTS